MKKVRNMSEMLAVTVVVVAVVVVVVVVVIVVVATAAVEVTGKLVFHSSSISVIVSK